MSHSSENEKFRNRSGNFSRRRLIKLGGLSGVLATLSPGFSKATAFLGPGQSSNAISPIMEQLSAYMSAANTRALPEEVIEKAKQHILDTFAAMISGSGLPPGRAALEFARNYGGKEVATVVASRIVCGPIEAAFANGVLAHSDETDDSHGPSRSHPGVSTVPAGFASGEQYSVSGAHFIRAVTLGYDIGTRVSMSLGGPGYQAATHRSTHGTAACFCAGAAAGCAAGLSAEQMRLMLDYTAQQTSGIGAWSRDAEHMEKAFLFAGKPAGVAVLTASLIRAGWSGVQDIFSGSDNFYEALAPRENGAIKADPAMLVDKLGEHYEISRTNIKKWTVGSPIQAPLDALVIFFKQRSFTADDVQKVVVRIATDEANTVSNRDIPDICMEHMVAVMLLDKTVTFQSVHDKARMKDSAVLRVRSKVEVIADPRIDARRPRREAIVELTLNDGTQLSEWVRDVRGTADNPMTRQEVVDKARDLIAPVLGSAACTALVTKLLTLETLKDVRELRPELQRS
ncbi:MAG TPA: MmgE/PrpD family protein [Candidatus Acidoferrales bacterium]|jgi:2-methylcitrate dehydratase PrpD|nr:MmgE/PrpD family protein [Candidatus Acidoferrales bacterium]